MEVWELKAPADLNLISITFIPISLIVKPPNPIIQHSIIP
jgi:hypothetical protein